MATRTPEEVFAHHGQALGAEDLEDIVADYTDDAILVVQKQVYRGKDGARAVFRARSQEGAEERRLTGTIACGDPPGRGRARISPSGALM